MCRRRRRCCQQALTDLKKAALLVSAPEGIAQVTGKSLQQSAGDNIISTSGGHTDFSALKRFTVAAGEISLFAQKLGIKMFAGKGKVEIQAQGDEMTLDALKDIRISSSEGKLIISAKQEIILTSGGYPDSGRNGGVCGAGQNHRAGAVWQKFGGQSMSQAAQSWESTEFAITPEVRRLSDDSPVAGLKLGLAGGDGSQQKLATSASGATAVQNNVNIDSLNASYLDDN
jgi:type VI secretion system secreted protein VgrG